MWPYQVTPTPYSITKYRRKRSYKDRSKPQQEPDAILDELYNCCTCYDKDELSCSSCVLNSIRIKVNKLKKSTAKSLGTYIQNIIYSNSTSNNFLPQYYDALLDRINSKFAPKVQTDLKSTKSRPELVCKIAFSDKHIQDIDLSRIFRDKTVLSSLPSNVPKIVPTIVYSYTKPIRNEIFNYKETMTDLNVTDFIHNYDKIDCKCDNSDFKDSFHGHILTGNLNIVKNVKLRSLLTEGPQFREIPSKTNFSKLKKDLKSQIKKFLEVWSSKYKIPIESFGAWKSKVFHLLGTKLQSIQSCPRRYPQETLKNKDAVECLKELKENFVLTPVDKAASNISFTCKKYYIKTVLTEVGIWPASDNFTYTPVTSTNKQDILDSQFNFNLQYNIRDNLKINELPYIYAIPKFHKTPVKFRFIISSSKCQTKPLAKVITKGLKLCQSQHESWCNVLRSYTGINHFFIIDKNKPILNTLNDLSYKQKAKTIETFDFSTLYTMIKHENLIENLNWYIDKAFNGAFGKGKKFMSVYDWEAKWVSKPKNNSCYFDKNTFQIAVKYLIENSIFEVGNVLIQQTIGIPMGTDPGPFMANAHLHYYEFAFQEKYRKTNYGIARSLNHTFRYIDDVTPINDSGNFQKHMNEIYPADLILTKENIGTQSATVLDLGIEIHDGKFDITVYDKTNNFNFKVVKYPSLRSNIPDHLLYNVFYSQMIRFFNICNDRSSFLSNIKMLVERCKQKGATTDKLFRAIHKLSKNHTVLFQTLDLSLYQIVQHINTL